MYSFLVPRDVPFLSDDAGIFGSFSNLGENLFNSVTQALGNLADFGADNAGRDARGGTGGVGGTNTNEAGSLRCAELSGSTGPGINTGVNGMTTPQQSACIGRNVTTGKGYSTEGCPECERLKNLFNSPTSYTGVPTYDSI